MKPLIVLLLLHFAAVCSLRLSPTPSTAAGQLSLLRQLLEGEADPTSPDWGSEIRSKRFP